MHPPHGQEVQRPRLRKKRVNVMFSGHPRWCSYEMLLRPRFSWIAAIYEQRGRRSHFRPVLDIARITRMVAWKIISRGFDLPGLVRSLRGSRPERTES